MRKLLLLICTLSVLTGCVSAEREKTPEEIILENSRKCRVYEVVYDSNGSFAGRIRCDIGEERMFERKTK